MNCRIITNGGLGNQLFQYTFAHFLAYKYKLKVELTHKPIVYKNGHNSKFQLEVFKSHCKHIRFRKNLSLDLNRTFWNFAEIVRLATFTEKILLRKSHFTLVTENEYLKQIQYLNSLESYSFEGYWQNWKFVDSIKDLLIPEIQGILDQIEIQHDLRLIIPKNYLLIHIRRGDYLLPRNKKNIGVIRIESYLESINKIKNCNPNLKIITLTDDVNLLTTESFSTHLGKIIGPEFSNPWILLKLMSKATCVIAANSTLSWWGGYLCMLNGGEVIIPKPWFKSVEQNSLYDFLHPNFTTYISDFYEN